MTLEVSNAVSISKTKYGYLAIKLNHPPFKLLLKPIRLFWKHKRQKDTTVVRKQ